MRLAELRRIDFVVGHIRELLKDADADPQKIIQVFQARTEGLGKSKDAGFSRMSDIIDRIVANQELPEEQQEKPISTGIPIVDSVIEGFSPGKLYLLGGRTRKGKSALAGNFALAAINQGKSVWFVSMEMPEQELGARTIAYALSIDLTRFKGKLSVDELTKIKLWNDTQRESENWVTTGKESLRSIDAKVKLRKSLEGLDLLILDNLQLIREPSIRERVERLKHITEELKIMAKEHDIAVLLLCQLNGDAEDDDEVSITSWAGCKTIADDADVTMILTTSEETENKVRDSQLLIHKVRGGVGNIDLNLAFIGKYQAFEARLSR